MNVQAFDGVQQVNGKAKTQTMTASFPILTSILCTSGPQISCISISWELIINTNSQAPPVIQYILSQNQGGTQQSVLTGPPGGSDAGAR